MQMEQHRDLITSLLVIFALIFAPCALALTGDQAAKLLAFDGSPNDEFGGAVAVDGDIAVIGARRDKGPSDRNDYAGSAYVFIRTNSGWQFDAKLTAPDFKSAHFFGESLGVSGNTVVIGARGDADNGFASGAVYVFTRTGTNWVLEAKLYPLGAKSKDVFGSAVAVDGNTILVGAPGYSVLGNTSGAAYVFSRSGTTWTQEARLLAADDVTDAFFGDHVDVKGDVAVIGAHRDNDNGLNSGSAYVFTRAGTNWTQEAKLLDPQGAPSDFFGGSVAVGGGTVVVGSPGRYLGFPGSFRSGSVFVFTRAGTNWNQEARLIALDGRPFDSFGASVDVDGDRVVIGTPLDDENGNNTGSTYVFTRTGTAWDQAAKLNALDREWGERFGNAVAIDGDTMVIGAWEDDDNGLFSGSAYVFSLRDDKPPTILNVVASPNPAPVGSSVALTATIDDSATDGSTIISAVYTIDAGLPQTMLATDGSFDSATENVVGSISPFPEAGVHNVCVSGTDSAGNTSTGECILLAVYDPDAGFVTGGGWIDSPAGAYFADPSSTGKANFGFVSKYKKGATTPTGNTEFQFKAGGLNFHSSSYDWLVVNQGGANAQFKGLGSINGSLSPNGNPYEFMLWVGDNETDTFRIRIWYADASNMESEVDIYDNGFNQGIDGGSIIVHTGNSK
jgi:hypothetical protein